MMDFLACSDRPDVMLYARVVLLLHVAGTEVPSTSISREGRNSFESSGVPYGVKLDWTLWTTVFVVCLFLEDNWVYFRIIELSRVRLSLSRR